MIEFLRRMQKRRMIKRICRAQKKLSDYYGRSKTYTEGQIKTVLSEMGVPRQFLLLGYGIFLSAADFKRSCDNCGENISYQELRREISDVGFNNDARFSNGEGFELTGNCDFSSPGLAGAATDVSGSVEY